MRSNKSNKKGKGIEDPVPQDDCETVSRYESTHEELESILAKLASLSNDFKALMKARAGDRMSGMLTIRCMVNDIQDRIRMKVDPDKLSNRELLRLINLEVDALGDAIDFLKRIEESGLQPVGIDQSQNAAIKSGSPARRERIRELIRTLELHNVDSANPRSE